MKIDIENITTEYGVIYTDPPWNQTKGNARKCRPNQTKELDYPVLSMDEIKNIHQKVFSQIEGRHNVFMWTIDKYLHETECMMKTLGYQLHARMIWDKENGIAPAFTVRFSHEYLLWFYKKGNMLMPLKDKRGKYTTVFREQSTKHSKKPICVYQMLDELFPDSKKLELFARNEYKDWDCWGNQTGLYGKIQ